MITDQKQHEQAENGPYASSAQSNDAQRDSEHRQSNPYNDMVDEEIVKLKSNTTVSVPRWYLYSLIIIALGLVLTIWPMILVGGALGLFGAMKIGCPNHHATKQPAPKTPPKYHKSKVKGYTS